MLLELGNERGGDIEFADTDAVITFAQSQVRSWEESPDIASFIRNEADYEDFHLNIVVPWKSLISAINELHSANADPVKLIGRIDRLIESSQPITYSSPLGIAFRMFLSAEGSTAALSAILEINKSLERDPRSSMKIGSHGSKMRQIARDLSIATDAFEQNSSSETAALKQQFADLRDRAQKVEIAYANLTSSFEHAINSFEAQIQSSLSEVDKSQKMHLSNWDDSFNALRTAILEKTRLKRPVELWRDIAKKHERRYIIRSLLTIAVALLGAFGSLWATARAYHFAQDLFKDALIVKNSQVTGILRPTWVHELVLTASATLLYVTIYLWTVRILVRMMLSEHHLGVDARSREAMAETYLALTAENGAADEKDRAIVLAALFKPVTDGLVKDDALPLISPASLLANKLTGGS